MLAFNGSRIGTLARRVAQRFSVLSGPDVEAFENLASGDLATPLVADTQDNVGEHGGRPNTS
jgi:hypothetical protein